MNADLQAMISKRDDSRRSDGDRNGRRRRIGTPICSLLKEIKKRKVACGYDINIDPERHLIVGAVRPGESGIDAEQQTKEYPQQHA